MVYHGGRVIEGGYFVNCDTWAVETIPRDGGYLPGGTQTRYIKVAAPFVVVLGPLAGLAYLVAAPVLACAAFMNALLRLGVRKLKAGETRNERIPRGILG